MNPNMTITIGTGKAAEGLNEAERVGATRRLREFKDFRCAKNHEVPGTVAETFVLATELVNQEAPADPGSSTELVPVQGAMATAQVEAKKAQDQLSFLQQKHVTFADNLR